MTPQYKVNSLTMEITRRCNKRCCHCMRGEAENLTMSTEIIDRVFDEVQNVQAVVIGNGEALLEMDTLEYFTTKLLESPWTVSCIEVTTNGTVCDKRIIDMFESVCLNRNGRFAVLRISNDAFHEPREYEQAYSYYKPLVAAANKRIQRDAKGSKIVLRYTCEKAGKRIPLIYDGRAIALIDDANADYIHGKNTGYQLHLNHRIKINGDTIPCALQVLANGNVTFYEQLSYRRMDALSFGNILSNHLSDIIDRHNENCLLLCSEADRLCSNCDYRRHADTDGGKLFSEATERIYEKIVELRSKVRELFPDVPAQSIIDKLPFPTSGDIEHMIQEIALEIYQNRPHDIDTVLHNFQRHAGTSKENDSMAAVLKVVLAYLDNKNITRKYPYHLFGDETDIMTELSRKFEDNRAVQIHDNSKNYPCEMVLAEGFSIDYSEEPPTNAWKDYRRELHGYIKKLSG